MEMIKENPTKARRLRTETKRNLDKSKEKFKKYMGLFLFDPVDGLKKSDGSMIKRGLISRISEVSDDILLATKQAPSEEINKMPRTWFEEFYAGSINSVKVDFLLENTVINYFASVQIEDFFREIHVLSKTHKDDLDGFIESFELYFAHKFLRQYWSFSSQDKLEEKLRRRSELLYKIASSDSHPSSVLMAMTVNVSGEKVTQQGPSYDSLKRQFIIEFNQFLNDSLNDEGLFGRFTKEKYNYKNGFILLRDCFDACLLGDAFYKLINDKIDLRYLNMYAQYGTIGFINDFGHYAEQLDYNPYMKKDLLPKRYTTVIRRLAYAESLYKIDQIVSHYNYLKKKVKETSGMAGNEIWKKQFEEMDERLDEEYNGDIRGYFDMLILELEQIKNKAASNWKEKQSHYVNFVRKMESEVLRFYKVMDVGVTKSSIEWGERALTIKSDKSSDKEYFWEYIDMSYVPKEGSIMGHCGNSPRSHTKDKIFSLRSYSKKSKTYGVHVTLTMSEWGIVYEIKGRGNTYPAVQYQPMIVEFMAKDDRLKVVTAKLGHAPNADFDILKYVQENDSKAMAKFPTSKLDLAKYIVTTINSMLDDGKKLRYSIFNKGQLLELLCDDDVDGGSLNQLMIDSKLFKKKEVDVMVERYISDLVTHGIISHISPDEYEIKGMISLQDTKFLVSDFEDFMKTRDSETIRRMNIAIGKSYKSIYLNASCYGQLYFNSVKEMMNQTVNRIFKALSKYRLGSMPQLTDEFSLTQKEELQMFIEVCKNGDDNDKFLYEEFEYGYSEVQLEALRKIVSAYLEDIYRRKKVKIRIDLKSGNDLLRGLQRSLFAYMNFKEYTGNAKDAYIFTIVSNVYKLEHESEDPEIEFDEGFSIADYIDDGAYGKSTDLKKELYKNMVSICDEIIERHCKKSFVSLDYSVFEMISKTARGFLADNYIDANIDVGVDDYSRYIEFDDVQFIEYLKEKETNFELRIYDWLQVRVADEEIKSVFRSSFNRVCYRFHESQVSDRMRSDFEESVQSILDIERVNMNDQHHFEVKLRSDFLDNQNKELNSYEYLKDNYENFLSSFSSLDSLCEFVGEFYNDHLRSDQDYEFEYLDTDNVDWNEFYEQFAQEIWEDYIHEIEEFEKAKDSSDESDTEK